MNLRRIITTAASAAALAGAICVGPTVFAQDGDAAPVDAIDRIKLFDSLEQASPRSRPTDPASIRMSTAELRQQMAWERARHRAARAEQYAWRGHNPSRPAWGAIPMTSSRFGPRVVYVPVYYYPR